MCVPFPLHDVVGSQSLSLPYLAGCANRKDKSLRIMSQKFVMLFLVSKTQTVTLDAAARTLIDESQDLSSHSKYKSESWGERERDGRAV